MRLTLHADYSLRVMMYLLTHPERTVSTLEISTAFGISKNHLVRVVQSLAKYGFVEVRPGRGGGLVLGCEPSKVSVGDIVRRTEPDLDLVECFDPALNRCPIMPVCGLKRVLERGRNAFLDVLDDVKLSDLLRPSSNVAGYFLTKPLARSKRQRLARH